MNVVWVYNPAHQSIALACDALVHEVDNLHEIEGDYYLAVTPAGKYQLCDKQGRHKPLMIDFAEAYYRFRGGTEWLPKALKGLPNARVADVTAGWGRDSWLLAYRGFEVVMFERNPYLQVLLHQGLKHAQNDLAVQQVAQRLSLQSGDANTLLNNDDLPGFDVIYLDPMYPNKRKKAKVKKDMQALQHLLGGEENDGGALLHTALVKAKYRVVVKRPKGAPTISTLVPSYCIDAPNTRFDVYVCRDHHQ